jgi:hypothetical protein
MSKKLSLEREDAKSLVDTRPPVPAPGCAAARQHLPANIPHWIKFQAPEPNRPKFQHSKKSVGPMVFLAERANLVFLRGAAPLECYGTQRMSFLDWITPVPLLGAESCEQTALL